MSNSTKVLRFKTIYNKEKQANDAQGRQTSLLR